MKVTNLNFKVWVLENPKKGRGPLVSLNGRLNGTRSLASCAHDSCSATRRWPDCLHDHRLHAPPRASLSSARLGFEAKPDFFTSPLPSPLHRSHRILCALPPAIRLSSKSRALPLGAAAATSCTSVSSSAGDPLAKPTTARSRPDVAPHTVPLRRSYAAHC
jgi:hypothetical protein